MTQVTPTGLADSGTAEVRPSAFYMGPLFSATLSFISTAGAYYPAQPQYSPSVQPAPVMINPAQQQQQTPPPQQPPPQAQGPPKRERKPVECRNKSQSCAHCLKF